MKLLFITLSAITLCLPIFGYAATSCVDSVKKSKIKGYPMTTEYRQLSGRDKQTVLYLRVEEKLYTDKQMSSHEDPGFFAQASLLVPSTLLKTFTHLDDEFVKPRKKIIHTFGSVAKVDMIIAKDSPYSGLFATGNVPGIMRLSLAKQSIPYTPGFALKLFVNGQISQNIFAMDSLEGQESNYNFFENNFKTKISAPTSFAKKLLAKSFRSALEDLDSEHGDETLQSVRDLTKVRSNGEPVADPIMPASLVFVPTKEAQMSTKKGDTRQRLNNASKYKDGTVLYEVFALAKPGAKMEPLGHLVLRSTFVSSKYGDRLLFFRHNID